MKLPEEEMNYVDTEMLWECYEHGWVLTNKCALCKVSPTSSPVLP